MHRKRLKLNEMQIYAETICEFLIHFPSIVNDCIWLEWIECNSICMYLISTKHACSQSFLFICAKKLISKCILHPYIAWIGYIQSTFLPRKLYCLHSIFIISLNQCKRRIGAQTQTQYVYIFYSEQFLLLLFSIFNLVFKECFLFLALLPMTICDVLMP